MRFSPCKRETVQNAVTHAYVGAVLAGGASQRMGTDKAFIEIGGLAMVERAAGALRQAGLDSLVVVGGDLDRLRALGLRACADLYPQQGPLGAVVTALHWLDRWGGPAAEAVVTLPCDVVEPQAAAVRAVVDRLAGCCAGTDAVVPAGEGSPQWLHAAWRRRCRPLLTVAFARGVRAPKAAVGELSTVAFEVPGSAWFRDADLPEEVPRSASP